MMKKKNLFFVILSSGYQRIRFKYQLREWATSKRYGFDKYKGTMITMIDNETNNGAYETV